MLVNLVSPPVPSLNILSVIILVQIINLSRRGCNKELLLKPSPLPAPAFFTVWLLRPISDTEEPPLSAVLHSDTTRESL